MYKYLLFLGSLVFLNVLSSNEPPANANESPAQNPQDILKISEAFGHLIGKNIETLGVKFDIQLVIKGLQDATAGKKSPMSEAECVQALTSAQETALKEQTVENLKKAEVFLSQNIKNTGVVELEKGKLQYKIEKPGAGQEIQPHFSPIIRFVGKFLDGSTFGSSKEDEIVALDETIPGLKEGMIGMKEGEKRTLFIHPDLGYGTMGYLPPNSLLTFEIEVIKANAPHQEQKDSISSNPSEKSTPEIADQPHKVEVVR